MKKNAVDLSHNSFMAFAIGNLQTLSVTPVIAGDQLSMQSINQFRLSPLRRALSIDALIDMFAFYVPHRHVYGSDWTDFMKEGFDESVTLGSWTHSTPAHSTPGASCLGMNMVFGQSYPNWQLYPYNQIWNRYFRHPTVTPEIQDSYQPTSSSAPTGHTSANSLMLGSSPGVAMYGYPVSRLKTPFTTGITKTTATSDHQIDMSATHTLDILDLNKIMHRYASEQERDYFAIYYNDVMKMWGSGVNIDADERPELIARKTFSLSGHDVNGSADANLGDFSGKAIGVQQFGFGRKFFPEHGSLWIMATVRFPTILYHEATPLHVNANPNYNEIAGEYGLASSMEPVTDTMDSWTTDAGATAIGTIPWGQWYRYHQNHIHAKYETVGGFPFQTSSDLGSLPKALYIDSSRYDGMFHTVQLGHAQNQSLIKLSGTRIFPTARESLYAGVNHLK